MATSENGWPVLEDRPPYQLVPYIDYEVQLAVRPGGVAVVLLECARRWHEEVEPLDAPGPRDEWGWAYRPVRGKTDGFSNHASATAIDLNATRHPRGTPTADTLTDAQIARCRAIVQSMKDKDTGKVVVRWGGDYKTSKPDAMHWEIAPGATADMVRRVSDRIESKYAELEDEMTAPTAAEVAAETVKQLLAHQIINYLDKNKDGKKDPLTVEQALAGAFAEGYVGRVLESAPEPGIEELKVQVSQLQTTVTELTSLVHQLVEAGKGS